MKKIFFTLLFASVSLQGFSLDEKRFVEASLAIGDFPKALEKARQYFQAHPAREEAFELLVKALARNERDGEMMQVWQQFHDVYPQESIDDKILGEICWAILRKGSKAPQLPTRLVSLLGSAMTQDVYALEILKEGMESSNVQLRAASVELSSMLGDQALREEIERLYYEETSWEVRVSVYEAIVRLHLTHLTPDLLKRASEKRVSAEEKQVLITTLAALKNKPEEKELELLVASKRSQLLVLASKLLVEAKAVEQESLLKRLVNDPNREVKRAALESFGLVRLAPTPEVYEASLSKDPYIAIVAAWVLLLAKDERGEQILESWLKSENEEARVQAAAALAKSGAYGIPLAKKALDSTDPFVKANASLALLHQRVEITKACDILYDFLRQSSGKLMWGKDFFAGLQKSTHVHSPVISNYPEAANQAVHLEILNLLAIVEYPKAAAAIKEFLQFRHCEIVGMAAEVLLGEGDEAALALVETLLEEKDKEIRLQAALLLAVWGHSKKALPVLLESYPLVERTEKVKILESLMEIGDKSTLPFLIERLKEPSQSMRVIGAAVLLQILNH